MDNDWKSSGHGTLSEQESRARQLFFCSCLFLMCCSISFPLFALLNSAIIFMLLTLQSCVKLIHIKNETWCFFVLFNQQTQSLFTNTMFFSFYVPSHMHLQIRWASSNDFSVLMVLIQCLFWFIHIGFFFTLFKESVGFVLFISPMQHSHIHTVFKHYHEQDAMIEKQKFVQCHHWLVKIGEKKQDEMEKMSCEVTYNGEGMVETGIRSEKFLRIRILEKLKETPFFGPSS